MSSKISFHFFRQNFISWVGFPYLSLLIWMLPLLLLGIGDNSLMAHDEGLYAWRSRLMYDSGDWINPWQSAHHKTPGFYWLVASFYSLFGISEINVRLPSIIGGILSVLVVYEIGKILLTKKVAWLAAAILSVEFLWLQYSRLGTPDVSMIFLVLLGILSLLKAELNFKHRYFWGLIAGLSFSLGFLLRSFMIFLPIVALSPYLILQHRRHNHLANPMLYCGFLLGLAPTLIWLRLSSLRLGNDSFTPLINFVTKLGSNQRRNNNWIYYFWNVPILAFPWSFFGSFGAGLLIRKRYRYWYRYNYKSERYTSAIYSKNALLTRTLPEDTTEELRYLKYLSILIGFPLILFFELSIFSTRLSHYSLCLYPFIALLAAVGLSWLGKIWNQQKEEFKIQNISLYISSNRILQTLSYTFGTLGILLLLTGAVVFFASDRDGEIRHYGIIGIVLGFCWLSLPLIWIARCRFGKNIVSARYWIGAWLISSWLTLAVTGSNGLLSNYNPDFQAFLQQPEISQTLKNHPINFVEVGGKTGVLINFYTPKHGKRIKINQLSQLSTASYAWIRQTQAAKISQPHRVIGEVQKYQLIYLQ